MWVVEVTNTRFGVTTAALNVAVIVVSLVIGAVQAPVPVHAPDQPAKVAVPAGAAVKTIAVPQATVSVQSVPQAMPAGLDVTVPLPVPALTTVSVHCGAPKVAVTITAPVTVTVQVGAVPVQPPPDQPWKVDAPVGVAVSVTVVPGA